ncbi:S8 family serine peptidase [Rhizobium leguminosarum]|nr:S8 family serine peptidase [Rhizobium leguminosarum]
MHRTKVSDMIARMRQCVIRMETFGAKPIKPLSVCKNEVQKCDALIVIVSHRYGWVPSIEEGGDGIRSITWWEVQWALDADTPVYAFLVDEDAQWAGEREQDRLTSANSESLFVEIGNSVKNLQNFRNFLKNKTTIDLFISADDLAGKIVTSLHDWLLEQAITAERATYQSRSSRPVSALSSLKVELEPSVEIGNLYWREQLHILSAHNFSRDVVADDRLALIAGKANTEHPALTGAAIRSFDARLRPQESKPDDFTTAHAALLVGKASGGRYLGILPSAQLLIIQALDERYTSSTADITAALNSAVRSGARIVCLPLGGAREDLAAYEPAFRAASELGVIVVCAAGNEANKELFYPAAYPHCISVTAVDTDGHLAAFSNYGNWITASAIGVEVPVAVENDSYSRWSGTSLACAAVAGAVAIMLKSNPKLTLAGIKKILRNTGHKIVPDKGMRAPNGLRILDIYGAAVASKDTLGNSQAPQRVPKRKTRGTRAQNIH